MLACLIAVAGTMGASEIKLFGSDAPVVAMLEFEHVTVVQ